MAFTTQEVLYSQLSSELCDPLDRWRLRDAFRDLDKVQWEILHHCSLWLPNWFDSIIVNLIEDVVINRRRKSLIRKGTETLMEVPAPIHLAGRMVPVPHCQFLASCMQLLSTDPKRRSYRSITRLGCVRDVWDPAWAQLEDLVSSYTEVTQIIETQPSDLEAHKELHRIETEWDSGPELYGIVRWLTVKMEEMRKALHLILNSHLRFVNSVARDFSSTKVVTNWLSGIQGLRRATMLFDTDHSPVFHSYAKLWIRQSIIHGFRKEHKLISVPPKYVKISTAYTKFIDVMGKPPTPEDLGITPYELTEALMMTKTPLSLDLTLSSPNAEERDNLSTRIPDPGSISSTGADMGNFKELRQLMDFLPEKHQKVLALSCGSLALVPGRDLTSEEIREELSAQAAFLGLS